ncbi:protein YIPF2-like [Stegodyphus dumicola]|uniref:protein YIPF2-like n=1 Tax=Stegodyphus dumicola TaxID=202533 RepID=UPI0015AAE2BE|nr:protein YIPF2-like [Stegodyphus dumicola]
MASSQSSVIQFSDTPDAQSELQFQDLTLAGNSPGGSPSNLGGGYTSFTPSPDQDAETDDLLGTEKKDGSSFWKFSYYQSFFDVDTDQVVQRVLWSMVPLPGRATYLDRQIRPKPDLYGIAKNHCCILVILKLCKR